MKGFFSKAETSSPYRSEKGVHSCVSCQLYKSAQSPRMKPYGNFKKKIMVIGEGPGHEDDENGRPWQGPMGKNLKRIYSKYGVDLFEDCLNLNAVNCRAVDKKGENKTPTEYEISCCRQKVLSEIDKHKPKVIILHGSAAISSMIGYRWKRDFGGIMKWAGWTIPDREFDAWLCPTFHPHYVEKQKETEPEVTVLWEKDLKRAFEKIDESLPTYKDEMDCVEISKEPGKLFDKIRKDKPELLAFDIETTGLKPYNTDLHEIATISFCYEDDKVYAVPFPKEPKEIKRLKLLLESPDVGKIAANMKYEDTWVSILYGITVNPWVFDTMQAAHILDNRPGITSLKFQSYVQFGLVGYDDDINPFLKSPDSNSPNRIKELISSRAGLEKLLLYNGVDSLMTYKLAKLQMEEMGWGE